MIAEGDWSTLLNFLDIQRNSAGITAYAGTFWRNVFRKRKAK
jgi:hypothetical protein